MVEVTRELTLGESIRDHAKSALAAHILTELSEPEDYARVFQCRRPNDGAYRFQVVVWPGYLAIHGDIGRIVLSRTSDMIAWARGAVRSPSYFFEKAEMNPCHKTQWCGQSFKDWVSDEVAEELQEKAEDDDYEIILTEERLDDLLGLAAEGGGGYDPTREIIMYLMSLTHDDGSACLRYQDAWELSWETFTADLWWSLECCKKFLELLDGAEVGQ